MSEIYTPTRDEFSFLPVKGSLITTRTENSSTGQALICDCLRHLDFYKVLPIRSPAGFPRPSVARLQALQIRASPAMSRCPPASAPPDSA
jgi:hypothetical protein